LSIVGKEKGALEIKNSTSEEFNLLRTSLLQSMLVCFSNNKMKGLPQHFYEIGMVYDGREEERLCFGVIGDGASLTSLQPYLQTLLKELGFEFELKSCVDSAFIKGRCVEILVGGKAIGVVGSVHPEVIEKFGLTTPVALCELRITQLKK
jgi:phenylalanyl-tRNA synthetase beta chain